MSDYAPFPEHDLELIGKECTHLLSFIRDGELRQRIVARREVMQNTIAAHTALRERCLLAEMNLRAAVALLEANGIGFVPASVEEPNRAA